MFNFLCRILKKSTTAVASRQGGWLSGVELRFFFFPCVTFGALWILIRHNIYIFVTHSKVKEKLCLAQRLRVLIWKCANFQSSQGGRISPGPFRASFPCHPMSRVNPSLLLTYKVPAAFGAGFHPKRLPIIIWGESKHQHFLASSPELPRGQLGKHFLRKIEALLKTGKKGNHTIDFTKRRLCIECLLGMAE